MAKKKNSLENDINELEKIIEEMENLDDDLDRAIELYKKGSKLAINCSQNLSKYEKDIYILKEDTNNKISLDILEG